MALPAVGAQRAVPAHLLRRPVEQHRRVLRAQQGHFRRQTVIHRLKRRRRRGSARSRRLRQARPGVGGQRQPHGAVQQRQRRAAQQPLPPAAGDEIGQLRQHGGADGGRRAEPGMAIEPGGAEGGVGAEDQHRGGGMAQPRLEIQKRQRAHTGAYHRRQSPPAHTGHSHRRQRPWRVLSSGGYGGEKKSRRAADGGLRRDTQGALSRRRKQVFHGLSLLCPRYCKRRKPRLLSGNGKGV